MISEEVVKVTPYKVKAICDKCGVGEMIPTGKMKMTNPPLFEHKCDNCGKMRNLREKYPAIRFKEIAEVEADDSEYHYVIKLGSKLYIEQYSGITVLTTKNKDRALSFETRGEADSVADSFGGRSVAQKRSQDDI